ncbi:cation ABC transporter substrate-binding protein [Desulfobacter hydrogenophilus]|uniref:Cation ABC transporter substrate-binding protein n=1 Tax=Desulfobacter hydrogenophilus TaxID=2291 RepID=A0A328FC19_9BACT|nr:zinc ABC transporter substrate-binding protein [Desulfobacter hydrogenophilus]NDY71352.1 zinc ABC transporter solute-binding protein [Desulfobacter hydrogenophilus]QBH12250.1 cation ABC transporter substrate-binding protein [Desulfobacter hydrogenophilus]RAM01240.1 cation ABC transporter substrate-binding protein [Desulfobacter hydrogenophilus]
MKRFVRFFTVISMIAVCCGHAWAEAPVPMFVSILPQQYFVQQIGKDKVAVSVMVQPGASPATYEPKPLQMAKLSKARLYFSIGVPFETFWLDKIASANPDMTIVHTDKGIEKQPMDVHHHEGEDQAGHHDHQASAEEDHDIENDHGHAGLDPHIWLSPKLVKIQAGHILDALATADPENKDFYTVNYNVFIKKLDALDQNLAQMLKDNSGMQFMVFHPSWGYFARDYNLKMIPIEIEGKNPKPADLQALIEHARNEGINVIFVQPQFSTKSAELVAREIHGQVLRADPLALDWLENMKKIAAQFKEVLK